MPAVEAYARKFGGPEQAAAIIDKVTAVAAEDGIEFRMDRALRANTFDAHRLLWLAAATGHQEALKQRLLEAYFTDGLNVADHEVLADCAADVGLERDGVLAFLDSDDGVVEVRAELDEARGAGDHRRADVRVRRDVGRAGRAGRDTFAIVLRRLGGEACRGRGPAPSLPATACADDACEV